MRVKDKQARDAEASVLYWVADDDCTDMRRHGYIGITANLNRRQRAHLRRFGAHCHVTVIGEGTRREMREQEFVLRPHPGIGWNRQAGGGPRRGSLALGRNQIKLL